MSTRQVGSREFERLLSTGQIVAQEMPLDALIIAALASGGAAGGAALVTYLRERSNRKLLKEFCGENLALHQLVDTLYRTHGGWYGRRVEVRRDDENYEVLVFRMNNRITRLDTTGKTQTFCCCPDCYRQVPDYIR
jgi:hypothetical protein